jgi:hypothetical protein
MMEAWFHADKEALQDFYGNGFKESALKKNPNVEEIPKKDLEDGLREATKKTQKGDYFDNKTSHGPRLFERPLPTVSGHSKRSSRVWSKTALPVHPPHQLPRPFRRQVLPRQSLCDPVPYLGR